MERLALSAAMDGLRADRDFLVLFGDRRQTEMVPASGAYEFPGEVVLVQALHNKDNGARPLVVEAREKRSRVPFVDISAGDFRLSFVRLLWIVDYDQIGAAAGERSADRNHKAPAACAGDAFGFSILGQTHPGEKALVPVAADDGAELPVEGGGDFLRIGDAGDT